MEISGTGKESKLGVRPSGALKNNTHTLPDLSWGDLGIHDSGPVVWLTLWSPGS
jgi:hypothetical protein